MKDYKVGDTIYAKGTVRVIDDDDKKLPYYVDFGNTGWIPSDNIIDELPTAEPVKPVLPKDVADEMEEYKATGFDLVDYFSAFNECADDVKNSSKYAYDNTDEINNQRVANLADAWNNGYTVEKEPTWYIKVPGKFVRPTYYAINDGSLAFGYLDEDKKWYHDYSAHAFTDEEIKKYDLENFHKELVADD